jgi:ABC-2 type transport system ATP-binding protein
MANADKVTDVLVALRSAGIHLSEMSVQKPTLDEVFLTITGHDTKEKEADDE